MSGDTIQLTDKQRERIDAIKTQSTEGGKVPPLSDSAVIDSLLDTWDAVEDGYYTEDHTPNDELQELVSETWDYRKTLKQRRQEDMDDEDTEAVAYLSGQMSSLIHMIDALEARIDD